VPSIKDDRGYNQGFKQTRALKIRTERRSDYIVSKIRKSKDIKILEIGCGTGELSYLLAKQTNQSVLGTDICIPFIECAKNTYSHPKLEFGLLDFNNIENSKYKDKKFDYIVGNGILHHLFYNLNKTLKIFS
jgi:2-polyprenyl-3-methyl-5-hydroxy-6-metoxy-1,4-benzoquinol methylase